MFKLYTPKIAILNTIVFILHFTYLSFDDILVLQQAQVSDYAVNCLVEMVKYGLIKGDFYEHFY